MASCGSACGSNCVAKVIEGEGERLKRLSLDEESSVRRCTKCGEEEARKDCNGLCAGCFRAYLYGKFKLAVTSNAMISPTDKVLVAFSGGPSSRVALEFIHEMQSKALISWDASNSQALPVFTVGVVFIEECAISGKPSDQVGQIRSIVSSLSPPSKDLHIVPIENVFPSDLRKLVNSINDATGREDFLRHLRMLSLQKVAFEHGYSKLVLGLSASAMARHVISATVKGQGYSLPADVQYVDTRWKVPVVLPIRDCLEHELVTLCYLESLKNVQVLDNPCTSINGLVSSFIARLREDNPSREHTILRTAGKLKPFNFNKFSSNQYEFVPSRLRPKFQVVENGEPNSPEVLCPICTSPLSATELASRTCARQMKGLNIKEVEAFFLSCCESCHFQILPKEETNISCEGFFELLPKPMVKRSLLRDEIKDYLLDYS
ncbi:cytoplasmic tRNA 2-thiolation protein 2 [Carex littledalei]|uniref:Cytoplasmic tRNA 2-thiolation protein 2 n=1 Tax=Carex littledalei TaxID=544730 RepID=A0A833VN47_9POAL|nr:cytoplasmic tRNA 2-thiolation protein 2 [Carex littledalei]